MTTQNYMSEHEKVDNEFVHIIQSKIQRFDNDVKLKYGEVINFDNLIYIGEFIDNLKPKSKFRDYKYQIINFLNILLDNKNLSRKEIVVYVQEYLSGLFMYLHRKHSFVDKFGWFWTAVFTLVLDLILILTGVARYYYYIPVFTILSLSKNLYRQKKAKKEGRYIDF